MEWISVKKSLPCNDDEYLIYSGKVGNIFMAQHFDGCWVSEDFGVFDGITHWMPLPPPPEK